MGNSNKKKLENEDYEIDKDEDEYYNELIKDLEVDTEKIKKNLKNHKRKEKLIILINRIRFIGPSPYYAYWLDGDNKKIY